MNGIFDWRRSQRRTERRKQPS